MKRAVGYFRVSTTAQAGERNVSLAVQRERFAAHCDRQGYAPISEYVDVMSGRRADRTHYQRMLDDCRAGKVDVVVTFLLDRFGRNTEEILFQTIALKRIGVEIECTNEDVTHPLIYLIQSWRAGEESKLIGKRVRASVENKVRSGTYLGRLPFGWRDVGGQAVIEHSEARIVGRVVQLLLEENLSLRRIVERLREDGERQPNGRPYPRTTVYRILRRLGGEKVFYRPGSESNRSGERPSFPIALPPHADAGTIARVHEVLARHRKLPAGRSQVSDVLLAGLTWCGECGRRLRGHRNTYPTRAGVRWHSAYQCVGRIEGNGCPVTYVNGRLLEEAVIARITDLDDPERAAQLVAPPVAVADGSAEVAEARGEIAAMQAELRESYRLFRAGVIASEQQLATINADLLERQGAAERRLEASERRARVAEASRSRLRSLPEKVGIYAADFAELDRAAQKARLQELIERVVAWRDGRFAISYRI